MLITDDHQHSEGQTNNKKTTTVSAVFVCDYFDYFFFVDLFSLFYVKTNNKQTGLN